MYMLLLIVTRFKIRKVFVTWRLVIYVDLGFGWNSNIKVLV